MWPIGQWLNKSLTENKFKQFLIEQNELRQKMGTFIPTAYLIFEYKDDYFCYFVDFTVNKGI